MCCETMWKKLTLFRAASLALSLGLGLLTGCSAPPPVPPAPPVPSGPSEVVRHGVFTYVDGDVQVQAGGVWSDADTGMKVSRASVVKTGRGAQCDLQFGRLGTLHLSEDTVVALTDVSLGAVQKAVDLEVVAGTLTAKVAKLTADQRFHVRTDTVVAGVRGTRFLVSRTGAGTSVAVAEGLVALVPPRSSDEVQKALETSPAVGPGREAGVTRAGEVPVIGPVGDANRKILEQTASMTIADTLPVRNSAPAPAAPAPGGLAAPAPSEPAPGAVLSLSRVSSVNLVWKPVPGATGYEVTLSVPGPDQPRSLMSWTTPDESVRVDLPSLPVPGAFQWEVTAVKSTLLLAEEHSPPGRSRFTVTK